MDSSASLWEGERSAKMTTPSYFLYIPTRNRWYSLESEIYLLEWRIG